MSNTGWKLNPLTAAVFFDGEGCVFIAMVRNTAAGNPSHNLRISIAQKAASETAFELLNDFQMQWGGELYLCPRPGHEAWDWVVSGKEAWKFIEQIQPHVRLKREQIELACEFIAHKRAYNLNSISRTDEKFAEEIRGAREEMRQQMKELKVTS